MPLFHRPLIVLVVLALDLATGPLPVRALLPPGPPILIARVALTLTRRLDRPSRGAAALRTRGVLLVAALGLIAVAAGFALVVLGRRWPSAGIVIEALVLWSCVRVYKPLARLGRAAGAMTRRGPTTPAGRGVLEQTAISFLYFVVAPVFWYVLGGLPALLLAVTGWGLQRAATESSNSVSVFGGAADRFERALAWAPSRVAGLALALGAAAVPAGRPGAALRGALRSRGGTEFGPVAALAGGLGVVLAGPSGVGVGGVRLERGDLIRAIWLYAAALLIVAALVILAMLAAL